MDLNDIAAGRPAFTGKQVPFSGRLGKPEEYAQMVESIIASPMPNGETIRMSPR